jgi:hypothetical protein
LGKLIYTGSLDRPTVSGNPVIRIGEHEGSVSLRDYQLETIQPGETIDVTLQITSQRTVTQILAVALQEIDVEDADTSVRDYIGISSTNLAFVEPLEIVYESWITSAPVSTATPLDNPDIGHQIALAFDLKMTGEQSIEVLGITYRHENMVGSKTYAEAFPLRDFWLSDRCCASTRSKQVQRFSTSLLILFRKMNSLKVSRHRCFRPGQRY